MSHGHAVVIGGSMAGMCAAKAVAPHFDRVTVVDRDAYPGEPVYRKGVPQARHVHALLARGRNGLEQLFPGFAERMIAAGASDADAGLHFATLRKHGWQRRLPSQVPLLLSSRVLLEFTVRELLRQTPNVTFVESTDVVGLTLGDGEPRRVIGVSVTPAGAGEGTASQIRAGEGAASRIRAGEGAASRITADLVIDAGGRGSRAPAWLAAAGLAVPQETVVDCFAGYSTRWYQAPPAGHWPRDWWWRGLWIEPDPPDELMGGVLFPVEGGRWIVTLIGHARHYPPTDEAGFNAALRSLRSPAIAEAVALAEPISPVYGNRSLSNRFRHYERLREPLGGFVAVGDGVCVFNPNYGQGMSTAALSALTLARSVATAGAGFGPGFARSFFRAQARAFEDAWLLATGADLDFPGAVGKPPPGRSVLGPYVAAVFDEMRTDPVVLRGGMEILHLLRPTTAFFALPLLSRVAWRALRGLLRRGQREPIPTMPELC